MNNLKFRAWDKKHKEMFEVVKIEFHPNIFYMAKEPAWIVIRAKNEIELMQSTGLKDKSGVEIFEGDILTDEGEFEGDYWDYGIIKFDETDFTYYIHWQNEEIDAHITDCSLYSIAGNIYENKELLR